MTIKLRTLSTEQPLLLVVLGVGMTLVDSVDYWILSFMAEIVIPYSEQLSSTVELAKYLIFIKPAIILSALYLTLKLSKIANPVAIGAVTAISASSLLCLIEFIALNSFQTAQVATNIVSIIAMVWVWAVLVQTMDKTTKALSDGYFIYLAVVTLFNTVPFLINEPVFGSISLVLSVCLAGIQAYTLGFIVKMSLRVFGLKT